MSDSTGSYRPGRHLVQVPGPTNVPRAVLEAMAAPTMDHRSAEFAELTFGILEDVRGVFGTEQPVILYAGSGTGGWEAALVNTLSPGDKVLAIEVGQFATLWANLAAQMGLDVERVATDWRSPVDAAALGERLAADPGHEIKAVLVVHNETSTGVTSDIAAVRRALDETGHPAMLFVDAVSSLGSIDYRHDEWGVDVTIAGSQKGLMLPPGMALNALSERALAESKRATLPRAYWEWNAILEANSRGFFPATPPTNLLYGLRCALDLLEAEGLPAVFARHERFGRATRAAVEAWGLELQCADPSSYSPTVTAVRVPEGHKEEEFRAIVLGGWQMDLGAGLGQLAGKVFRIGHLGDFDDLSLVSVLAGIELGLGRSHIPHKGGGVSAALEVLASAPRPAQ